MSETIHLASCCWHNFEDLPARIKTCRQASRPADKNQGLPTRIKTSAAIDHQSIAGPQVRVPRDRSLPVHLPICSMSANLDLDTLALSIRDHHPAISPLSFLGTGTPLAIRRLNAPVR